LILSAVLGVGIERVKEEAFETDGAARSAGSLPSIPASIEKASAIAALRAIHDSLTVPARNRRDADPKLA